MMVAVCYRNVGKQVPQLASAYDLLRYFTLIWISGARWPLNHMHAILHNNQDRNVLWLRSKLRSRSTLVVQQPPLLHEGDNSQSKRPDYSIVVHWMSINQCVLLCNNWSTSSDVRNVRTSMCKYMCNCVIIDKVVMCKISGLPLNICGKIN